MAKITIEKNTLVNIGDAIREKTGNSELISPLNMPAEIRSIVGGSDPIIEALEVTENGIYTVSDGVDGFNPVTVNVAGSGDLYDYIPESVFTISGSCNYLFYGGKWDWFIEKYGDRITTADITRGDCMFQSSKLKEIPFDINLKDGSNVNINSLFMECSYLEHIPYVKSNVNNIKNIFSNCSRLREIPEDWADYIDWSYLHGSSGNMYGVFYYCRSLRKIPESLLSNLWGSMNYNYTPYNYEFLYCNTLDEVKNIPVLTAKTYTSNMFNSTFGSCYRLKDATFAVQEDGTPYAANWKNQTITLNPYIGYAPYYSKNELLNYNSGITEDKEVTDDTTYQALKDDPDWWTLDVAYSRYNHDSAVNTINSLPDTSAYLASAGGTNTIKFKGESGSATDGGAINTLTAEEIAVATAKGWTVSLV